MFQRWVLNIAVFMAFLPAVSYAAIPSTNYVNNADHLSGGMVASERIAVYNKYDKLLSLIKEKKYGTVADK